MTGRCVRSSVGSGSNSVESFFFFFFSPPLCFSPRLSPRLAFLFFPSFFCPPLISSPPFPLPSFLFSFYYHSFPINSFFFTSCFPLSAAFLSLFPPFPDFFLPFLSSLSLFFFPSLTQNDDFLWCNSVYSYDRSNWILTDQNWILIYHFGRLCSLPILYTVLKLPQVSARLNLEKNTASRELPRLSENIH